MAANAPELRVGDEMLTGKSVGYDEIVSVELGVIFRAWDFCVFSARIMPDNALPVGFSGFREREPQCCVLYQER
jgi:hypothetical protein